MDKQTIIEMVGYIGSFLVLVSFLMTSVFKLRIINTIGSFIFTVYALIIHSYPTAVMNFCLILINLHFLWKMRHTGHRYDLVKVAKDDRFLNYILEKQREDIDACFPGLSLNLSDEKAINRAYLVTCEGNPVGICLGLEDNKAMTLVLDYSLPEYRDFSIGQFLVNRLKKEGIEKLIYKGPTENHMAYLDKLGYKNVNGQYEKVL